MQFPVLINCRDRVVALTQLVKWLERVGQEEIYLLDNDSGYEPLLDYYDQSPHKIIYLGGNYGHHAPWNAPYPKKIINGRFYIVSDPDIVPVEECPDDALDHFYDILMRHPDKNKVGFSLKIDDIPDCYEFKAEVIAWESVFSGASYAEEVELCYSAPIDTTFALYNKLAGPNIGDCLRTGWPYMARHMTWYIDSANLDAETKYYRRRATCASQWALAVIPPELEIT